MENTKEKNVMVLLWKLAEGNKLKRVVTLKKTADLSKFEHCWKLVCVLGAFL